MGILESVDVIVPAYNAEKYLRRAVESVFRTGYSPLNVLIVEDGSTDRTCDVATQLCLEWPGRCFLFTHEGRRNRGVSASRNLGVRSSRAKWVAFLDADDFYLPNRFSALMRVSSSDVDGLYESAVIQHEIAAAQPEKEAGVPADGIFGIQEDLSGVDLLRSMLHHSCWPTSAITVQRSVLIRTGLFDTNKRIAEDCDVWYRLAAIGNIVPGSSSAPVAVYWRHPFNTWSYDLRHRKAVLRSMLDSWAWSESVGVCADRVAVFSDLVPGYAIRSIIAAREDSHPVEAARIAFEMVRAGRFRHLLRRDGARQLWAICKELARGKWM